MGMEVPRVLLSGNHLAISKWRKKEALRKTLDQRPDLLKREILSEEDLKFLEEIEEGRNARKAEGTS
jgi:tRNA (guanine37-N1)-methyltransferase